MNDLDKRQPYPLRDGPRNRLHHIWLWVCWQFAKPVLSKLEAGDKQYTENLRRSAERAGIKREWVIMCHEKADALDAAWIGIRTGFGCISFSKSGKTITHYK